MQVHAGFKILNLFKKEGQFLLFVQFEKMGDNSSP